MPSNDRVLARRYALALFQVAGVANAARVKKDLAVASKLLRDHHAALRHPLAAPADKIKLMRSHVGEQAGEDVRRFLDLLIKRKRFELLPYVAAELEKIADEAMKTGKAQVRTAKPLSEADKAELEKRLSKYLGRAIVVEVKEDPSLIAGLVVKVGDKVLDASASRQLQRMKEKLLSV